MQHPVIACASIAAMDNSGSYTYTPEVGGELTVPPLQLTDMVFEKNKMARQLSRHNKVRAFDPVSPIMPTRPWLCAVTDRTWMRKRRR
jgi:hypothetical protein